MGDWIKPDPHGGGFYRVYIGQTSDGFDVHYIDHILSRKDEGWREDKRFYIGIFPTKEAALLAAEMLGD